MDNRPSDGKTEKRKVNTGASGSGVKGSAKDPSQRNPSAERAAEIRLLRSRPKQSCG